MSQAGDDLRAALNLLQKDGWCTYTIMNDQGAHCASGAVAAVVCNSAGMVIWASDAELRRLGVALEALMAHVPEDFRGETVPAYNNTRESFTEIEEWFEKAIADEGESLG